MDIVRVPNIADINDIVCANKPQQLQTPQQQQHSKEKDNNSNRNGLNQTGCQQSSAAGNGNNQSSPKQSPGSDAMLAHGSAGCSGSSLCSVSHPQTSSDSGNSSCTSGNCNGSDSGTVIEQTKAPGVSGEVTTASVVTAGVEDGEENDKGEKQSLLSKNIYVNKIFDGGAVEQSDDDDFERSGQRLSGNGDCGAVANAEDLKPLLQLNLENEKRKPKSIVKSPSNLSFGKELNCSAQKQRLNLQFQEPVQSVVGDRPVHHVQFIKQDNGFCYGTSDDEDVAGGNKNHICTSPVASILSHESGSSSTSSSGSSSNENSSLGGYAEARPPDGGWGWVVCFASFMVNLIADGVTFSFGVLYVELLNYFGEGKGD